jgi:hypothetical protein
MKNIGYIVLKSFSVLHTHYIYFKICQMCPQYTKNIVTYVHSNISTLI